MRAYLGDPGEMAIRAESHEEEASTRPFTVAIMQPYFIPYAGYFRLFAASDLFVIYDCVQFPRRGWVHRNQLLDRAGVTRWLTLPLEKAPQDTRICDLRFAADADILMAKRMRPFQFPKDDTTPFAGIMAAICDMRGTPIDYLERLLEFITAYLGLPWRVIRSSKLRLPTSLFGQQRILAIAQELGAHRYVNAPGGRSLYEPAAFARAGIELQFLSDFTGPTNSILGRLAVEDRNNLAQEIRDTAVTSV